MTTSDSLSYRPDIDGLRAIAVVSVVAFHAGIPPFRGGFVGVDIFFVISGFLIGSIIHREVETRRFSFPTFYARRARRILPALFAMLLVASVAALLLVTPADLVRYTHSAIATIFAVSNVQYWRSLSYFSPAADLNPLLMTWTLGVEEQFYVFFPIVLLIIYRLAPKHVFAAIALCCAGSFALSVWGTVRVPTAAFFLLPMRAWELGAGTLLAILQRTRPDLLPRAGSAAASLCGIAGLALLLLAIFGFDSGTAFPGYAALAPVAGAVLLILAPTSPINRLLLASPPMVLVGLVSYSWYLWHWPFLSFARLVADRPLSVPTATVIVGLSFLTALVSWKFVEQPFRQARRPAGPTLLRYAGVTAVLVALIAGLAGGWPHRFAPELSHIETSSLELTADQCLANYGISTPNLSPACVDPDTPRNAVALLGDSHAAALAGALRLAAHDSGYAFLQITKSSCPPLIDVTRRMLNHPSHEQECSAFNAAAFKLVISRPAITTVILTGYWSAPFLEEETGSRFAKVTDVHVAVSPDDSRKNLEEGLEDTVRFLQAAGKHVILAKDVPIFDFDPLHHVESHFIPARMILGPLIAATSTIGDLSAPVTDIVNREDPSIGMIDGIGTRHPDAAILDLKQPFCSAGQCRFASRESVYYIDSQHLSLPGAQYALTLCHGSAVPSSNKPEAGLPLPFMGCHNG